MTDLFASSAGLSPVHLVDADVSYQVALDLGVAPERLLAELIKDTPWRQEDVVVWGKTFQQPRLVAWYGDPGRTYRYSSIFLDPIPWTERLSDVKRKVEAVVGASFNSVLLNYYRDHNDSMGLHSDDERELGPTPTIASVSLGAERTLIFKSKIDPNTKPVRLSLASGSLLIMKGNTQSNYKHGIAKETRRRGPRVNLTFRRIMIL